MIAESSGDNRKRWRRIAALRTLAGLFFIAAALTVAWSLIGSTTPLVALGATRQHPLALVPAQAAKPETAMQLAHRLMEEVRAASYPELRGADIQVRPFQSKSDYFRARFGLTQFMFARHMRYLLFTNAAFIDRQAPESGVRAIIAHELGHVLYYRQRNRTRLLGLVRLTSAGYTARFERWADLQAISRGYGEGLKAYREWLYQNIPAARLSEKKRNYFSPEEIDQILAATRRNPELMKIWLAHVPRNLNEILASGGAAQKP